MTPPKDADALISAIRARRSIKRFTDRPVARAELERLLELATLAPNHRMTQPWRFYVLGERAKAAYAALRAELKAAKVEDAAAAALVREKVEHETRSIPAMVAVAIVDADDPEVRQEDYAATFMGIENLLIGAGALGLGGYIHTGRILEHCELRELLGVRADERVVALLDLGEAAETPGPKQRASPAEVTRWVE
ncbi:MAG: nitroreductase family protein [Longimicrobiales bacterium]